MGVLALTSPARAQDAAAQSPTGAGVQVSGVDVTGTRLNITPSQSTQEVQVYTAETIDRSGQTTVTDFLNTLPVVSLIVDPGGLQTNNAATSVRLHGLPFGTTLVLIDGKRVNGTSAAAFNDVFDLNNIPLAAVERIEILPQGASAIYGSDAIAGAVNIVLKEHIEGLQGSVRYGGADHTDEWDASLAGGGRWTKGAFSLLGSYSSTSELLGQDRALTANADYTRFGSEDARFTIGNPGNVFSISGANLPGLNAPYAAVPAGFTGPPSIAAFASTAGQLNKLSLYRGVGLIPESHRVGVAASVTYDLAPDAELSLRLLYSHVDQAQAVGPAGFLFGTPGFQSYTVSAANPFNPFGADVGIGYVFPGLTMNHYATDYFLPTIEAKGFLGARWSWDVAGWASLDRERITISGQPNNALQVALNSPNPVTALDPFVEGPPGSPQLVNSVLFTDDQRYRGQTYSGSVLLRGRPLTLAAGDLSLALGAEVDRTNLYMQDVAVGGSPLGLRSPTVSRTSYAIFGETRIPVFRPLVNGADDLLDVTGAGRYDDFSDFGGAWTAETGVVSHPLQGLTFRANWGQTFKAPSLYQLYQLQSTMVFPVHDPVTGSTEAVSVVTGGNPSLKPESGTTLSFGFNYAANLGFEVSVNDWMIHERNNIQLLPREVIVDNPSLFPGAVIRASSCVGGPPCPITTVNDTFANFGDIDVSGLDYHLSYRFSAGGVEWEPQLSATETYQYNVAFQPGEPTTSRVSKANDDTNWAPRWKMNLALDARTKTWDAVLTGRYVGPYRDYDPLTSGTYLTLGDLWYVDAVFRYNFGTFGVSHLRHLGLEVGAVNLFDQQPQFSNKGSGFWGFDYLQADMRGRFVYCRIDVQL